MGASDIILISALYPAMTALLLIGAKKAEGGGDFMSRAGTKAICGFFSICVILHHISQELSDYRLFERTDTHGLGAFFHTGYLFVGWFLFCSGFGLTKSFKSRENYLEGFGKRRVLPIAVTFIVTGLIYLIFRARTTGAVLPANPYSWYVYTLLVFYAFFFFAFGKLKKCRILCTAILVLLYCVFCRVFAFGEWWFNSAPVFVLGMVTAAYENRLKELLKTKYYRCLIAFALFFALFFAASLNIDAIYKLFGGHIPYSPVREARPLLQAAAASMFCLFISALGMKIRFDGKQLAFLGGLTLETYLIQGIFIRLFGKYLFDGKKLSPLYIPNGLLYTAAVIAASVICAFALKKLNTLITGFLGKAEFAKVLWKDAKKAALVIGILAAVITVVYGLQSRSASRESVEKLAKYRDESITIINAEGTEIAAYVAGSGDETVVLLRSTFDACPTMTLRPLADAIAEKGKYRAVVLDFPGQGFSGEAKTERTADNIAGEIHSALLGLGIKEPVAIAANEISGIYAMSYIEKYPGSVSAFIGIDAYVPEAAYYLAPDPYSSGEEFSWALRRYAESSALKTGLLNLTGYSRQQLSMLDYLFPGGEMSRHIPEISEMFMRGECSDTYVEEQSLVYANCMSVRDAALPEDMPALLMLDNDYKSEPIGRAGDTDIMACDLYGRVITNGSIQSVDYINNYYVIYYNPKAISGVINDFLSLNEKEEDRRE